MNRLHIIFSLLLLPILMSSQDDNQAKSQTQEDAHIKVISLYHDGDILLRWGPTTEGHWLNGKNSGYQIRRQELNSGSNTPSEKVVIAEVYKPWTFDQFKQYIDGNGSQHEVMIMGESLYGEWETIGRKTKGLKDWGLRSEELKGKYLMALLSADLNFNAAVSGGIGYKDSTVEPGKQYAYYVTMVGYDNYLSAVEVADTRAEEKSPVIRIEDTGERELQVDLSWSRRLNTRYYTAYQIETSVDGTTYNKINDIPYINTQTDDVAASSDAIIYTHRLTENYKPLYYRVRGINAFGILSEPSDPIRLMGKDRTPPTPPNIDTIMTDPMMTAIGINWNYTERADDLAHTRIKRSTHATGVYLDLVDLPHTQLSYQDPIDGQHLRYYYKLCAVDTARNEACTGGRLGIINDKIPPVEPTGLRGTIDSSGIVVLDWDDNPESDVRGYYIQLTNGKKRVFGSLVDRPWIESNFTDTLDLSTLTEDVYYRVSAVDYSQNYGEFSDVIRLVKPDTIPPSASVIKKYIAKNDYIKLDYVLSKSHDATYFTLQRKEKTGTWLDLAQLAKETTTYIDSTVASNTQYTYRIVTLDDAGNQSTNLLEVNVKSADVRHSMVPSLSLAKKEDKVILTWENKLPKNTEIKIYKGSSIDRLLSYRKLVDESTFSEEIKNGSHYRVRFYFADGSHSQYSKIVKITN